MKNQSRVGAVIVGLILGIAPCAIAQTQVGASVIGAGGGTSSDGRLALIGTVGQAIVGSTAGDLLASQGFWHIVSQGHTDSPLHVPAETPLMSTFLCIPNPASGIVDFRINVTGPLSLELFDNVGRYVRTIVDGTTIQQTGTAIREDFSELPSGSYSLVLTAGVRITSQALLIVH